MITGWIFEENVKPFVELMAFLAGYKLYDGTYDWVAIEYGLKETDADVDKWYSYTIGGAHPLMLSFALNPGATVVVVRVTSEADMSPEVAAQLGVLITICQDYSVAPRH